MGILDIEDHRRSWPTWEVFRSDQAAYMEMEFEALSLFVNDTHQTFEEWKSLGSDEKVRYYQMAATRLYKVEFKRE
jgi:hypothetical protein